jgi:hypothetical protein
MGEFATCSADGGIVEVSVIIGPGKRFSRELSVGSVSPFAGPSAYSISGVEACSSVVVKFSSGEGWGKKGGISVEVASDEG